MKLEYSPSLKMYICTSSVAEKDIPKQAGFIWDRMCSKHWATKDPEKASKLARWASPACRQQLEIDLKAQQEMIGLSSATDANINLPVPKGMEYFGYQKAGILFSWQKKRTYIGDEMGLGKTIQAIGLINAEPRIRNVLVVTKASLRVNWRNELLKWLVRKDLSVGMAYGNTWPAAEVVVINYEILTRHKTAIDFRKWDLLILDEAHLVKNPKAERSKMIYGWMPKDILKRSERVAPVVAEYAVALSGTPIENRPIELYPILKYLDPMNWGNWFNFITKFCDGKQEGFGWNVKGSSNKELLQKELRKTVMVRRMKKDVLKDLPPKRYQVIEIPAEGKFIQQIVNSELAEWERITRTARSFKGDMVDAFKANDHEAFNKLVGKLLGDINIKFKEFSKQRKETGIKKLPYIKEYIKELLEDEPHKILVFGYHQEVIEDLERAFPYCAKVYGPTPADKRQGIVDRYNNTPDMYPFFGSIGAAGAGLNITSAWHVIFVEEDIVPGRMWQAEDRAHRIGQTESVLVTHLVLEGSLDAKLANIAAGKGSIIDVILGSDQSTIDVDFGDWGKDFVDPAAAGQPSNTCPF